MHYHTGPVPIAAAPATTTVTSLVVPAAGTYMFWAKTYVTTTGFTTQSVTCDLKAGGDLDEAKSTLPNAYTMAMNVAHVFTAPGTVDLICSAPAAGGQANFATVSGIQVANLTRADG